MSPFVCINRSPSFSATSAKYLRLLIMTSCVFARVRAYVSDCLFAILCVRVPACLRGLCQISCKTFVPRDKNLLYYIHTIPHLPSNSNLNSNFRKRECRVRANNPFFQNAPLFLEMVPSALVANITTRVAWMFRGKLAWAVT